MRSADHEVQREGLIKSALNARKITADTIPFYRRLYEQNPQATRHLLTANVENGGLLAGTYPPGASYPADRLPEPQRPAPVAAQASSPAGTSEAYPAHWLPEVQNRQPGDTLIVNAHD